MKKYFFYIVLTCIYFTANAQTQTIKYTDAALLFSNENINGTARFNGMSGAFGALGGDLSSAEINPAGLTVFKHSESAISINNDNFSTDSNFYNTSNHSRENNFNLNQAGVVLVFDNNNDYWNKFSVAFNYNIINDFDNDVFIKTNNNTTFEYNPSLNLENNEISYINTEFQSISNQTRGVNSKNIFSLAARYDKKTSLGISLIVNNVDFSQKIIFNELSNDGNSNLMDAQTNQSLFINGNGIGFNFGILHKLSKNIRLGIAYQSPIWYDINEEAHKENNYIINDFNEEEEYIEEYFNPTVFDYNITSPSKLTASFAYIINRNGLVSIDYSYRDYKNIKIKPSSAFNDDNNLIKNNYKNVGTLKIGSEYRFDRVSLRAGYQFNENPNKNIENDNYGYSLGLGFKINDYSKIDFAYQKQENHSNYSYFNNSSTTLNKVDSNKFTATLTVGL